MSVIVMEVKRVQPHPHGERLLLYEMEAPGQDRVQIIANTEQIYGVADRVAVALPESILKDGTQIKPAKLRGILSQGLALERVTEPVGADLSLTYCQQVLTQGIGMQRWPSIELLSHVRRSLEILGVAPQVTYRAKVKLDGTNAGIQIGSDGRVMAQSRTQILTLKEDNYGFAQWVSHHLDHFARMACDRHVTLFGEWCGSGIQNRTAISQIDRRILAIFAVQLGGVKADLPEWVIDPAQIAELIPDHPDMFVLPYLGDPVRLDFGDLQQLEQGVADLNQRVAEVESCDPWVKHQFGIEGLGEGIVLYPELEQGCGSDALSFSELMFKAKGEKHQGVKLSQPVQLDPEVAQSIEAFVDLFVTPARLQQGLTEACGGQREMQRIGAFLKWLAQDVQKESQVELEAAQLSWKDVHKAVTQAGKRWFQERC